MKFIVYRNDGIFEVLLLKHKLSDTYSFVNITKGHICPCVFDSKEKAIDDLENYKKSGKIIKYELIN